MPNDKKFLLRVTHRKLKIAPTTRCQPAFQRLKLPSEKANWPHILNLEGTISE